MSLLTYIIGYILCYATITVVAYCLQEYKEDFVDNYFLGPLVLVAVTVSFIWFLTLPALLLVLGSYLVYAKGGWDGRD